MMNNKPHIMADLVKVGDQWQARAWVDIEGDNPDTLSTVIGTPEETISALEHQLSDYCLEFVCIKCGNSEGREFAVDRATGICEWCTMSEGERNGHQEAWRREENYVFGPPDCDYPPDRPSMPY